MSRPDFCNRPFADARWSKAATPVKAARALPMPLRVGGVTALALEGATSEFGTRIGLDERVCLCDKCHSLTNAGRGMLYFRPMSEEDFLKFRQRVLADYACERVAAGDWGPDEAAARSAKALLALLPQGLATPGHGLMIVVRASRRNAVEAETCEAIVGSVWWQRRERAERPRAHLLDLYVEAEYRGQGYGRGAMQLLEATLGADGVEVLTLNVFGRNYTAIQLYRHLGYEVVTLEMAKRLGPGATAPGS